MLKHKYFYLSLCSIGLILCSCNSGSHVHAFGEWKYFDETKHVHECSCGERQFEEHRFLESVTREPTHTQEGILEHKCSICGYAYNTNIPKTAEHTFDQKVIDEKYKVHDATCVKQAEYYYSCLCGEHGNETFFAGDYAEHVFEEISRKEATFTKDGEIVYKCHNCDEMKTEKIDRLGIVGKEKQILESKQIKILTIGNSLTDDVCHNLHDILHAMGIENVTIGKMWVGGTGISYHATHMLDNASVYTFDYYDETSKTWVTDSSKRNFEYAFNKEKWDFVSLSTVGPIVEPEYDENSITTAINYVMENGNDAIPIWYIPGISRESFFNRGGGGNEHGYTHAQALNGAKDLIKQRVQCHDEFQAIVPSLGVTETLINTYNFDIFHRDDIHYSYPLGTVVTGLTFAKTLLPNYDLSKFSLDYIEPDLLSDIKKAVEIAQTKPFSYNALDSEDSEPIPSYITSCGAFKNVENGFKSLSSNSLLLKKNETFTAGSIEFKTRPLTSNFNGVIYCVDSITDYFWEVGANYYFAGISSIGEAFLSRVLCKSGSVWDLVDSATIKNFDPSLTYSIKLLYKEGHTALYVNNELMVNYQDKSIISGSKFGFRVENRGTTITNVSYTHNPDIDIPPVKEPEIIDGYTLRNGEFVNVTNGFSAIKNNSILESVNTFEKGVVSYTFKSVGGGESGFIFGLSNNSGLEKYWENDVSYYMAAITSNGGCGIGAVNWNGNPWIWLTEPSSVIKNFSVNSEYNVQLIFDPEHGDIQMLVDDIIMTSYNDSSILNGTLCGFRAGKVGNTFTNISYSSVVPPKDDSCVDTVPGWMAKYDEQKGYFVYSNKTNNATRIYKEKTISSSVKTTGTISFDYKTNGLEYDAEAKKPRSNWCAGIMFATSTNVKAQKGQFVVFGKTSGAPRRIASMFNNENASQKQTWNLAKAGSSDIIVNENEFISISIQYDFTNATFSVTGNGKTSIFPMPDVIKNAEVLYIGLYGSSMTNGYSYGELTISNLVID